MAGRDLVNNVAEAISLNVATYTATTTGAGVDLKDFDSATVFVITGNITDGTHAISLEESDDNSTYTAVSASNLIGSAPSITGTDDNKIFSFGYIGNKQYIRVKSTVSGATTGGIYGAIVVKGHPRYMGV